MTRIHNTFSVKYIKIPRNKKSKAYEEITSEDFIWKQEV